MSVYDPIINAKSRLSKVPLSACQDWLLDTYQGVLEDVIGGFGDDWDAEMLMDVVKVYERFDVVLKEIGVWFFGFG